ncbi:N-formylglutamate deformylase [Acetobacter thailandicus]|uniref:N-formylglutamate deformylase n=1 Tax=Acetobacter thailandicus TaxID=1502842 RepID=A0ABT3QCY9_9PROT|nr:N-formylglutamate deformylase [Acetobacter thailandicus]MCX2563134.1 N-formylglutamate deformylase [Acetobacter thailandicus]NHN95852.1 N-formylglutamate deformylase [Acetobacter thailandicus]
MLPVYSFTPGDMPVLITLPHAGQSLPEGLALRMTEHGSTLPDTDWYMETLYDFAQALGVGVLRANYSRYVVDLNRGPDDGVLYPGRPSTGLVPHFTFSGLPVYREGEEPDAQETVLRTRLFWRPYHDQIEQELGRLKEKWGHAVLWDGHSIASTIPRLFEGVLPDLNFGTNMGQACAPELAQALVAQAAQASHYTHVLDGRFKGGYTTRHYGQPDQNIHAVQLELAQTTYLETEKSPWPLSAQKAAQLKQTLLQLLRCALAFKP